MPKIWPLFPPCLYLFNFSSPLSSSNVENFINPNPSYHGIPHHPSQKQ